MRENGYDPRLLTCQERYFSLEERYHVHLRENILWAVEQDIKMYSTTHDDGHYKIAKLGYAIAHLRELDPKPSRFLHNRLDDNYKDLFTAWDFAFLSGKTWPALAWVKLLIPSVYGAECKFDEKTGKSMPGTSQWLARRVFALHILINIQILGKFESYFTWARGFLISGDIKNPFDILFNEEGRYDTNDLTNIWGETIDPYTNWYIRRCINVVHQVFKKDE